MAVYARGMATTLVNVGGAVDAREPRWTLATVPGSLRDARRSVPARLGCAVVDHVTMLA